MKNRLSGFTLIEMVVVIAIISIILTITFPQFHQMYAHYELNGQASTMVSDLRALRQKAIVEEHDTSFQLDPNTQPVRYLLYMDIGSTAKITNLPLGFRLDPGNFGTNRVYFHPNGTSSRAGKFTIQNDSGQLDIFIDIATGNIRVE